MGHSKKQKLQKARAYFKFVVTGLSKPINYKYLSNKERELWDTILSSRDALLAIHDNTSREMGLNVPEHRCFICKKEAKHFKDDYWLCHKHFKEFTDEMGR